MLEETVKPAPKCFQVGLRGSAIPRAGGERKGGKVPQLGLLSKLSSDRVPDAEVVETADKDSRI